MRDLEKYIIGFVLGAVLMGAAGLVDRYKLRKHYERDIQALFHVIERMAAESTNNVNMESPLFEFDTVTNVIIQNNRFYYTETNIAK